MHISTRFSVAIHILLSVEVFKDGRKVTSDFIAGSVNTNPVVIRRLMSLLSEAGLIEVKAGTGGIRLAREAARISLLDIYRASEPAEGGALFKIHEDTAPGCPVGGNIEALLRGHFNEAQEAMEKRLGETSLGDLLEDLDRRRRRKGRP
jgi:DNA-binding IscR family transcriptional regulator